MVDCGGPPRFGRPKTSNGDSASPAAATGDAGGGGRRLHAGSPRHPGEDFQLHAAVGLARRLRRGGRHDSRRRRRQELLAEIRERPPFGGPRFRLGEIQGILDPDIVERRRGGVRRGRGRMFRLPGKWRGRRLIAKNVVGLEVEILHRLHLVEQGGAARRPIARVGHPPFLPLPLLLLVPQPPLMSLLPLVPLVSSSGAASEAVRVAKAWPAPALAEPAPRRPAAASRRASR